MMSSLFSDRRWAERLRSGAEGLDRHIAQCDGSWIHELGDVPDAMRDVADLLDGTGRPEIVCICGSSRFIQEIAVKGWELEKAGEIVLSMHLLPSTYPGVQADHQAEAEGVAEQMDELHLRKIDLADRVLVMNIGGYIGESTQREIRYALEQRKIVDFVE